MTRGPLSPVGLAVLGSVLAACQPQPPVASRAVQAASESPAGQAAAVSPAVWPAPSGSAAVDPRPARTPDRPQAPWQGAALTAAQVDQHFHRVWQQAGNRRRCALLAWSAADPLLRGATSRPARFSGGWAVAYDQPGRRSAFGVAGADTSPEYRPVWPESIHYRDGSRVSFGPEGGRGPDWLAYVSVPGQQCLYNVWSQQGREHLLQLLEGLRRVQPAGTP